VKSGSAVNVQLKIQSACRDHCRQFEFPISDKPALQQGDRLFSYGDLFALSRQIGDGLCGYGLRAGSLLAITGKKSPELVCTVVACLQRGIAFTLIDPADNQEKSDRIIHMSRPNYTMHIGGQFSGQSTAGDFPFKCDLKTFDPDREALEPDAAYIFFTSGTTGEPKGIVGSRRGLLHFLTWEVAEFSISGRDRCSLLTGLTFDVVLRDMLAPLLGGATLVLPPEMIRMDGTTIFQWLSSEKISFSHAVPTLFEYWLLSCADTPDLTEFRQICFAGEPLSFALVSRLRKLVPGISIANLYGPTETTLAKFFWNVPDPIPVDLGDYVSLPVGLPLPNTHVEIESIRDESGQETGEITIATDFASHGYLNASDSERSRFELNSDGNRPTLTRYRTGDLGYVRDGLLYITGRSDFQVKIDGVRIEPSGVERLVSKQPGVESAVVLPLETKQGRRLACWLIGAKTVFDESRVRKNIAAAIHRAAVPCRFVFVERFPTTANGKLDRKSLMALSLPSDSRWEETETPANLVLLVVAIVKAWKTVFEVDDINPKSNFYALGGSSLIAAEITVALSVEAGIEITLLDVLEAETPETLALRVGEASRETIPSAGEKLQHALSIQQRRYKACYLPEPEENRCWCNMAMVFNFDVALEASLVSAAVERLVERHDSLRLSMLRTGGEVVQELNQPSPIRLDVVDLSNEETSACYEKLEALRLEEANTPIDVYHWPLFRVRLVLLSDNQSAILWNIHHYIFDGVSAGHFEQELRTLLGAQNPQAFCALPELPATYLDYSAWTITQEAGPAFEEGRQHWSQVLSEPYAKPNISEISTNGRLDGKSSCFIMPETLTDAVDAFARHHNATRFITILAAYFVLWHQLARTRDVIIGAPSEGRPHPDLANLIGNFMNLVVMRSIPGENTSNADHVDAVRKQVLGALRHQHVQYDEMMAHVGAKPSHDRYPLTTLFISYLDQPSLRASDIPFDKPFINSLGVELKWDVMPIIKCRRNGISFEITYRNGLFQGDEVAALGAHWMSILAGMVDSPDAQISMDLPENLARVANRISLIHGAP